MTTPSDPRASPDRRRTQPLHLADLLRMTAALTRAEWSAAADAMGYRWRAPAAGAAVPERQAEPAPQLAPSERLRDVADLVPPAPTTPTLPTLWRVGADLTDREASIEPGWLREAGPEGCFESDGRAILPRPAPLLGRARLARFLRRQLAVEQAGARVDLAWAVARLARLKPLLRLRPQPRLHWPQRVQLVVQTDPALGPLVQDLRAIAGQIGAQVGHGLGDRLRWLECPGGPQRMVDRRQRPALARRDGSHVIVVGDAGTYQRSERVREDWQRWAAQLERCGSRPLLLAPVPRRWLDGRLAASFDVALVDESPRLRLQSAAKGATQRAARGWPPSASTPAPRAAASAGLTALTALLAGIAAVEPALLRLARRAVRQTGLRFVDIATEVEFIQQPEVECDGVYGRVRPGAEAAVIENWRAQCASAQAAAASIGRVSAWARSLSPLLQAERAETWRRHWPEAWAIAEERQPAASDRVWGWLAEALNRAQRHDAAALRAYLCWLGRSNPELVGGGPIALQAAWVLAQRDHLQRAGMPAGIAWERMAWLSGVLGFDGERQALLGEGVASTLHAVLVPAARAGAAALRRDLPGAGYFRFERVGADPDGGAADVAIRQGMGGRSGAPFALDADAAWRLHIGARRLVIEPFVPPPWADAVWRDGTDWFAARPDGRLLRWVPRRAFALAGVAVGAAEFTLPQGAWWDDAEYRALAGDGGPIGCPPWADAGHGADRFGWWAAVTILGVQLVMRFVPPGELPTGSPASAPSRFGEGRSHPPMLTHGFWIADAACTRALRQAVTGGDASGPAGEPDGPVDEAEAEDRRLSLVPSLQRIAPRLQLRLPTEAEEAYSARDCPGMCLARSLFEPGIERRPSAGPQPRVPAAELGAQPAAPLPEPPPMLPLPTVFPFSWAVAHGCDRCGLWQAFEVKGVRQCLRWLPPGVFWMGSPGHEWGRYGDENLHRVRLSAGFWLGETVVTQALWLAVMGGANPARFQDGPKYPVECVSWHDVCDRFLPALERAVPGLAARLPSEAEWEYASREAGRSAGPFSFGDDISADEANFDGRAPYRGGPQQQYRGRTVPVDTFAPNAVGLREMHGGVCEWCQDWCVAYPDAEAVDPRGPASGGKAPKRVVRGGSWIGYARSCRSAYRYANDPGHRFVNIGFRLAHGPFARPGSIPDAPL